MNKILFNSTVLFFFNFVQYFRTFFSILFLASLVQISTVPYILAALGTERKRVHPPDVEQSRRLNPEFCKAEIRAVYWQGTKPGDPAAIPEALNSLMVFNQGL